ncbi:Hypothetical Protein FCC1311_099722 [Hondaea fermentalgiana]|uniref:Uncharacterized protein n=1 Tax=Hondaea fermentalgiana TaxID=2315210 RepID=A0A2R5GTV1_9STRA|nr:Hypothetical Protein FCC1311_099722 [Hondaea fermentalgiana]|eukprot:GBG33749.1 Hypothetical Protein FCC1311_099722 [Hondaea fermentalgiana]
MPSVVVSHVHSLESRRNMDQNRSFASSGSSAKVSMTNSLQGQDNDGNFMFAVAFACVVSGICALCTMALSLIMYLSSRGRYEVGEAFMSSIGESPLLWRFIVFFPIGAGGIIACLNILTAYLARLSFFQARDFSIDADPELALRAEDALTISDVEEGVRKKYGGIKQYAAIVCLALSLAFVIVQAVFAMTLQGLVNEIDVAVRDGELNDAEPGSTKARILDVQVAMFNECCVSQNYTMQGAIEACPSNYTVGSPVSCEVEDRLLFFRDALCTCYLSSEEAYETYLHQIRDFDVCNILSKADVHVDKNANVPGTGLSMSNVFSVSDTTVVGDPSEGGCGVGYAKGFQYVFYLWLASFLRPIVASFVALALVQLLAVLYGLYRIRTGYGTALIHARLRFEEEEEFRALRASTVGHSRSKKKPPGAKQSCEEFEPKGKPRANRVISLPGANTSHR